MALQTMYQAKSNSPQTTLTAIIAADATSLTVFDGSVLPPGPNLLTLGTDEDAEVVYYSTISGNVVSGLVRGYSGTTASVWEEGTQVSREFTSYDHDTFKTNIESLQDDVDGLNTALDGKQDTLTFDNTPTQNSNNPVKSGGIKTALDGKQNSLTFDTTPTASSSNPVTSGGIKTYTDKKILYFINRTTSVTSAATAEFCRISDSKIDANTVVLNCEFTVPGAITSGVTWTSAAGYISFKGICTSTNCKVNAVLGQKGN